MNHFTAFESLRLGFISRHLAAFVFQGALRPVEPEGAGSSLLLFLFEPLQALLQILDRLLLALDDLCEHGGDVHR
jgi:hypothetical protein